VTVQYLTAGTVAGKGEGVGGAEEDGCMERWSIFHTGSRAFSQLYPSATSSCIASVRVVKEGRLEVFND